MWLLSSSHCHISVRSAFRESYIRESSVRTILFICCLFTNWYATMYRY